MIGSRKFFFCLQGLSAHDREAVGNTGMLVSVTTGATRDDHLKNIELCKTNRHLVVDDAKTNRSLLRLCLEGKSKAIAVDEAENGCVALEKVIAIGVDGYDVIWTDVDMPIMTGLELTKQLRSVGFRKYVVVVTGNAANGKACKDAGVDLVCFKPIRRRSLDALAVMQLFE